MKLGFDIILNYPIYRGMLRNSNMLSNLDLQVTSSIWILPQYNLQVSGWIYSMLTGFVGLQGDPISSNITNPPSEWNREVESNKVWFMKHGAPWLPSCESDLGGLVEEPSRLARSGLELLNTREWFGRLNLQQLGREAQFRYSHGENKKSNPISTKKRSLIPLRLWGE